jgi:hypothetical protein
MDREAASRRTTLASSVGEAPMLAANVIRHEK